MKFPIINSPAQIVVVDTKPDQISGREVVSEPSAPKDQEFGNPQVSEISIEPIRIN